LELTTGNRVNYAINTIGGVRRDLDEGQIAKMQKSLDLLEDRTNYYIKTLPNESTIVTRTRDVGVLEKKDAIGLAAVGPTARASGVSFDVRRDDPYAAYDDIDFNVITREDGDSLGRVVVRCLEVAESIKIIRKAIDGLPEGDINVRAPRRVPEGEAVARVEAPRGELIHYAVGNGTNKPERHKVRAPTLANIPSLVEMLIGGHIADIPIVLAGIDPCFACMDRMAFVDQSSGKRWTWTMNELKKDYSR
jgi:NADH-quinone oxidoreductase subunit D